MRRMENWAQRFTIFLSFTTKKHEFLFSENFTLLRPRIMEKSHLSPLNGQRAARKSGRDAPFAHVSNARFSLIILQFPPSPFILYCLQYPLSSITTRERQVGKSGSRFAGLGQRYGVKPSFSVQDATFSPENHLYAKRVFHSSAGRIAMKTLVIFTNLGRGGPS